MYYIEIPSFFVHFLIMITSLFIASDFHLKCVIWVVYLFFPDTMYWPAVNTFAIDFVDEL